jgi:hypothetical protein
LGGEVHAPSLSLGLAPNGSRSGDTRSESIPARRKRANQTTAIATSLQLRLPQHPDRHRPERPVLLAVDQELVEGAAVRVSSILGDVSPIDDV